MKKNDLKTGDIVVYRGRKWVFVNDMNGKAYLALCSGEKKIIRGIQLIDSLRTDYKNLKPEIKF